jgi:RHS repeat-associated protein
MGRSAHVVYPDGHVRVQQYEHQGRIKSRCYQYGSQSYCYTASYDGAGNPVTLTDPYGGEDDYQYDALNRLTQVTHKVNGTTEHVESYGYNAIGAVKTTFDPTTMSTVTLDDQRPNLSGSGTADAAVPNTLAGHPVTLDGGGRITSLQGVTFTYDPRNRVTGTQYTSGSNTVTEQYGYDAFMRRVNRTHTETSPASSSEERCVFDGANLVATVTPSGSLVDAYLFAGIDHPLRLSRSGASYFYELDLAGNVRRLRDANGTDLGGYRYTAFGVTFSPDAGTALPQVAQPLRWKGRWFENIAGGAYEIRTRWWVPELATFVSIDLLTRHTTKTTAWGWPNQNPVRFRDLTGRGGPEDAIIDFFTQIAMGAEEGAEEGESAGPAGAAWGAALGAFAALASQITSGEGDGDTPDRTEVGDSAGGDCESGSGEDTGKQDKILSKGEIKKLQDNEIDPHDLKPDPKSRYDLFKKPNGDIVVKLKGGGGPGEPTGYNINDL